MEDSTGTDLLQCPICFEQFQEAVLLGACGHTFCKRCVFRLRSMNCPTCRTPFTQNAVLPNYALRSLIRDRASASQGPPAAAANGDSQESTPQEGSRSSSRSPRRAWVKHRLSRDYSITHRIGTEDNLVGIGVPAGLARLIAEEDGKIALRIFLLDNSGSTSAPDGQILENAEGGMHRPMMRRCTRWDEVTNFALEQAQWNLQVGTPCEFVLLNPLAAGATLEEGTDFLRVDPARGDGEAQLQALKRMLAATGPRGVTPLADRLRKIRAQVAEEARDLARRGQRIFLVLATDGLPTGLWNAQSGPAQARELIEELRQMSATMPFNLLVRLCTNDENVSDYYNRIDEETELELDIVDDIEAEAREVYNSGNRWLVYSPLIHRIREAGTLMKLFDFLDERPFIPLEICIFCQLLFQQTAEDGALPSEPEALCQAMRKRLPTLPRVYNPLTMEMEPPVQMREVEWLVLPKGPLGRMCGGPAAAGCSVQ